MKPFVYTSLYEENNGYWLPIKDIGVLFQVKDSDDIRLIGELRKGDGSVGIDIAKIISNEKYVYFFSRTSYELWRLDRKDNSIEYICYYKASFDAVILALEADNYVYIFPNTFSGIKKNVIRLSLYTLKTEILPFGYKEIIGDYYITKPVLQNGKISFASRTPNNIKIFTIDCKSLELTHYDINDAKYVSCLCFSENSHYILYMNKENKPVISSFSSNGKLIVSYDISSYIVYEDSTEMPVSHIIYNNKKLYLIHSYCDRIDIMTITSNSKFEYSIINDYAQRKNNIVHEDVQVLDNGFFIYSPSLGFIENYNWNTNNLVNTDLDIDDRILENSIKTITLGKFNYESEVMTLDSFCRSLL